MAKTVKKEVKKVDPKKVTPKKVTPKKAAPKGGGLTKPKIVSEALQKIVGKKKCSMADTMSLSWKYIKANDLQDPKDRRTIVPDAILAEVTGKAPFGMMQLGGKVFKHLSDE